MTPSDPHIDGNKPTSKGPESKDPVSKEAQKRDDVRKNSESKTSPRMEPVDTGAETQGSGGKLSSFVSESKGLASDIKEWVDLRVQLMQAEVEDRIENLANQVIATTATIVIGLFAGFFLLFALAVWLGNVVGLEWAGYGIVGLSLALITMVVHKTKPRFKKAEPTSPELPASVEKKKLPVSTSLPSEDRTMNESEKKERGNK